ncbi:MAG: SDR family oxidoreductase [Actinobacteria bacterium]|nr:SDR family oxidoreductase [Actinomycetota bacterium]
MARIVVLGASGFLGSHLCDELIARGDDVVGIDDLSSSTGANLKALESEPRFTFLKGNIAEGIPVRGTVDAVLNFASPASPPRYLETPIQTLRTGSQGTDNALQFALENNARFIMASTSEVYGDPTISPQVETYWGNVNSIGERSCYDEAKRYAEALCMAYWREYQANIGIVRIFNTYGPRLDPTDGRVVSNFVCQALQGQNLTVYGDGSQTRSFCYVDDEIRGILALLDSNEMGPINIGNPVEFTMLELAEHVLDLTGSQSELVYEALPADDPMQRCPDITLARQLLKWEPTVDLREGLRHTIDWFQKTL